MMLCRSGCALHDVMGQHRVVVEYEFAVEVPLFQHERNPIAVVLPHAVEWDVVDGCPERDRFVCLPGLALAVVGPKNIPVDR